MSIFQQKKQINKKLQSFFEFSKAIEVVDYDNFFKSIAEAICLTDLGSRVLFYLQDTNNSKKIKLAGGYDIRQNQKIKTGNSILLTPETHPIAYKTMQGQAVFIENKKDLKDLPPPAQKQLADAGEIGSFGTTPLEINNKIIGYLVIDRLNWEKYNSTDKKILKFISQKVSQLLKKIYTIQKINKIITAQNTSIMNIFPGFIEVLVYILPQTSKISLFVRDTENSAKKLLTFNSKKERIQTKENIHEFNSHPITKKMFEQGKTIVVNDVDNLSFPKTKTLLKIIKQLKTENIFSFVDIPIMFDQTVIGYLACGTKLQPAKFSQHDISLLKELTSTLSNILIDKVRNENLKYKEKNLAKILELILGKQAQEKIYTHQSELEKLNKPLASGPAVCCLVDIAGHSNFAQNAEPNQITELYKKFYDLVEKILKEEVSNSNEIFLWTEFRQGDEALVLYFTDNPNDIKTFLQQAIKLQQEFKKIITWSKKDDDNFGVKGIKIAISFGEKVELKLIATKKRITPMASGKAINACRSIEKMAKKETLVSEDILKKLGLVANQKKIIYNNFIFEYFDSAELKGLGMKKIYLLKEKGG